MSEQEDPTTEQQPLGLADVVNVMAVGPERAKHLRAVRDAELEQDARMAHRAEVRDRLKVVQEAAITLAILGGSAGVLVIIYLLCRILMVELHP